MSTPYIATLSVDSAHTSDVYAVATCDKFTVAASGDGSISLWNNAEIEPTAEVLTREPIVAGIHHIAVDRNGSYLVAVAFDGKVLAWDLKELKQLEIDGLKSISGAWACALPRAGSKPFAAIASLKGAVTLVDLEENAVKAVLEAPSSTETSPCTCVDLSPDAGFVAVGYESGKVRVFSTKTNRVAYTLSSPAKSPRSVRFSPSGNLLAVTGENTVALFTLNGGNFVGTLEAHTAAVYCVDWSPTGENLLSVAIDGTAKIWEMESRQVIFTISDSPSPLFCGAFVTPSTPIIGGSRAGVVTGGADHTVRWYREASGSGI